MNRFRQVVLTHPRLMSATALGVAASIALPSAFEVLNRALIGWNIAVWSYLCLMAWQMLRANEAKARAIAEREDETAVVMLVIMSIAATVSLAAIVMELAATKQLSGSLRTFQYVITGLTVIGSWCLVDVIFTAHYARMFYKAPPNQRPLSFPNDEQNPDYWDLLYFSLTIAVAAQTSDVRVMTRGMRKVVAAQSVLGFVFNIAILGLSINVSAGLIGS